jgi:putative transposase
VLNAVVHPADVADREGARLVLEPGEQEELPRLKHLWADAGYRGTALREWITERLGLSLEIVQRRPRWVWALVGREGWAVNKKRVQRLWREAGLKVPASSRVRKRRCLTGSSENGCSRTRAEHTNHVWSYDFAMDTTEDGRRLKVIPVVDEYNRECLALEMERSIIAEGLVEILDRLFTERGEPAYIRSDNGPEVTAEAIERWLATSGVKTLYIEFGAPWENAYLEAAPIGE